MGPRGLAAGPWLSQTAESTARRKLLASRRFTTQEFELKHHPSVNIKFARPVRFVELVKEIQDQSQSAGPRTGTSTCPASHAGV